jgi:hypothetical protein
MSEISFCPLCAGKLDSGDEDQFVCEDCDSQFFIQVVEEGENDDDEEDEEEEDETDEDEEEEEEDEY